MSDRHEIRVGAGVLDKVRIKHGSARVAVEVAKIVEGCLLDEVEAREGGDEDAFEITERKAVLVMIYLLDPDKALRVPAIKPSGAHETVVGLVEMIEGLTNSEQEQFTGLNEGERYTGLYDAMVGWLKHHGP